MRKTIVFIDSEIGVEDKKIYDIGAVRSDGAVFHSPKVSDFSAFLAGSQFLCGHNVIHHDLKYLMPYMNFDRNVDVHLDTNFNENADTNCNTNFDMRLDTESDTSKADRMRVIDTLYWSPLLFPRKPYHALLKDDKLQVEELNNPVNDAKKAEDLFYDEVNAFSALPFKIQQIFYSLLHAHEEFRDFFAYVDFRPYVFDTLSLILKEYHGMLCTNADIGALIKQYPVELAYTLSLIGTGDDHSITPPWLLKNYPRIENVMKVLRNTPCKEGCPYCDSQLDVHKGLKQYFGYDNFRTYQGEPLQEQAARAAVDGKSLLAVFPTGGGKSITFQLPALMAGHACHGLTVVISPLQSLMKDQVDNLNRIGIVDAVTVNGLLSPIERADAYRRVENGSASLLYISPEQLRSKTVERMLLSRNIVRFVIDEAHCFSAWGQDFRVDYLYIGDFIRKLQEKKQDERPVSVSCFTATAKQKVITDICDYFKKKLDLDLELFTSLAARENLHYTVLYKETEEEKYIALRSLIEQKNCPAIVYVSRTKRTKALAEKLTNDGFTAKPFYGKMDAKDKIANQEAFIRNEIQVIVATSAFGMGVDKKDVRLVVHYDISDSLENYVQEAGRAGRDPSLQADCYVLFNDSDLDKHFILLNQTKLSMSEIQQVWKAIKDLTKQRPRVCCSPLEIARQAGWDDTGVDIETRVKTAIAALETAGYITRGNNVPRVYATSILAKNMEEASCRIDMSPLFTSDSERQNARRIIKSLISSRSIAKAGNEEAESRIDYLADTLGLTKEEVIEAVNRMREDGLLADSRDMSAYILRSDSENKTAQVLNKFAHLEQFIFSRIGKEGCELHLKELNGEAIQAGVSSSSVKNIRTILYYLTIKNYIFKQENSAQQYIQTSPALEPEKMLEKFYRRIDICHFIVENLFEKARRTIPRAGDTEEVLVQFSLLGLYQEYRDTPRLDVGTAPVTLTDMEDALLYLSKIGAMRLEGGFLVLYNAMEIKRKVFDNKIRYKVDDYRMLDEFYKQKIRQIHIVGEYANLMVRDYDAALQFVQDYFQMDFKKFISRYFKGERAKEIDRNITPEKYKKLFCELSEVQSGIIHDAQSKYIVVAAGPGSGKTRVLVHKLASLLLLEDVKHDQLLMVTFSRAAATEFKKRLLALIGNAAGFVDIKTFHSYCFDLLGKIGSLEGVEDVVKNATELIRNGEVEPGRISKSVLVIDEAQDMDENEFALIEALMQRNEEMRVIAVGDDDQNIYEFRGSDSRYLKSFVTEYGATLYEMNENYRSKANIVAFSNAFAKTLRNRMKANQAIAVQKEDGIVQLVHHSGMHLEEPVIAQVVRTYEGGKACILTNTNDEALCILGGLLQKGIRAKLIQSMDGFSLYNLVEIRFFLTIIDKRLTSPVISDLLWQTAKSRLSTVYADSTCLENCMNMLTDFEKMYPAKYRSDLEEFIRESKFEDFYSDRKDCIYVSTIHKAKGREFDTVYMMLNQVSVQRDEDRRKLYVGMTRAKHALYIHYNGTLFDSLKVPGVEKVEDTRFYAPPEEIALQLTHRDVVLDFFKGKKELIFKLHSGHPLSLKNGYLMAETAPQSESRQPENLQLGRVQPAAKLSKACNANLERLEKSGYEPYAAEVRFVVAWKGEKDQHETAVLLPTIYLKRKALNDREKQKLRNGHAC